MHSILVIIENTEEWNNNKNIQFLIFKFLEKILYYKGSNITADIWRYDKVIYNIIEVILYDI